MNVDRLQQIPFSGASQFESGVCHLERPPIQDIVFKTKIRTDEKPLQVYPQKNFVMGERKNQNQKKKPTIYVDLKKASTSQHKTLRNTRRFGPGVKEHTPQAPRPSATWPQVIPEGPGLVPTLVGDGADTQTGSMGSGQKQKSQQSWSTSPTPEEGQSDLLGTSGA